MDLSMMNKEQIKAIKTTEGPLLIMAGAGSGKTRVLTHRVAYLLSEKDVPPYNILAITFTNKAAKEMRTRVEKIVGNDARDIWISTFHAMCVRILRSNINHLGYDRSFSIIDPTDQRNVVRDIMRRRNIDVKQHNPRSIIGFISNHKNELRKPAEVLESTDKFPDTMYADIYKDYQDILYRNSSVDFDDLIMLTIELFEKEPSVLNYYQNKFQYVHVDEYQDTNQAQYQLIQYLAKKYRNICVVGDSDQSIYRFRGADITNILNFEEDYPDATVVKLEENYRSSQTILDAANAVIKNNTERKPKNLRTARGLETKITSIVSGTEREEGHDVVDHIINLKDKYNYSDIAVLYRTNAQSRAVEDALIKSNIPYKVVGGMKFYDRKEIKDLMSFLRVIQNPRDDISYERIINVPKRGVGQKTTDKIRSYGEAKGISMYETLKEADFIGVSGKIAESLSNLNEIIDNLQKKAQFMSITELVDETLADTGYLEMLELEKTLESRSRIENLEEFKTVTLEFDRDNDIHDELLFEFLSDMALVSDQDGIEEDSGVTLMTIHASKGLEFPVVFVIGLEEGIFPSRRAFFDDSELEEERRLMYVALTRAEDQLYISRAETRTIYGKQESNMNSRFYGEIPDTLIDGADYELPSVRMERYGTATRTKGKSRVVTGSPSSTFKTGDKVIHPKFGEGLVTAIKGEGSSEELDVIFNSVGPKRLLSQFAPISKKEL